MKSMMPKRKKKQIITEEKDENLPDITKMIPKSNSKISELRDNRINEIITKPDNLANTVSSGMVKEAEERKEKKRKTRKKKNTDITMQTNTSNNDVSNNSIINNTSNTVNPPLSNTLDNTNTNTNVNTNKANDTNISMKNNANTSVNQTLDEFIKEDDVNNTNVSADKDKDKTDKPKRQYKRKKGMDNKLKIHNFDNKLSYWKGMDNNNISLNTNAVNEDNKVDNSNLNNSINNTLDNTNNETTDNSNSTAKKQKQKKVLPPGGDNVDNVHPKGN